MRSNGHSQQRAIRRPRDIRRYLSAELQCRTSDPKLCNGRVSVLRDMIQKKHDAPSTSSDFVLTERTLQVLMLPSSPTVASNKSSVDRIPGRNAMPDTLFDPCGLSMRVFNIQKPDLRSHCQIFMYTSGLNESSPSRVSMVAIQSPESERTVRSTRAGCNGLSSRLDTRFDGDTSSSDSSFDDDGENVCNEDG